MVKGLFRLAAGLATLAVIVGLFNLWGMLGLPVSDDVKSFATALNSIIVKMSFPFTLFIYAVLIYVLSDILEVLNVFRQRADGKERKGPRDDERDPRWVEEERWNDDRGARPDPATDRRRLARPAAAAEPRR